MRQGALVLCAAMAVWCWMPVPALAGDLGQHVENRLERRGIPRQEKAPAPEEERSPES